MVLAIVKKEFREIRAFAALAMGLYLIYLGRMTGQGGSLLDSLFGFLPGISRERPDIPFIEGGFSSMFGTIGAGLAIALGFRQSAWEPSQGTALYLLHLPLSRRAIYLTKILTGAGLLMGCMILPILIYGIWAATPGTHPGPFEWSMAGLAFRTWLIMPLAYLGAFASGLRPARWFGSRLLPLASVPLPAIVAAAVPQWWLVGVPVLALAAAMLVCDILRVIETRDF